MTKTSVMWEDLTQRQQIREVAEKDKLLFDRARAMITFSEQDHPLSERIAQAEFTFNTYFKNGHYHLQVNHRDLDVMTVRLRHPWPLNKRDVVPMAIEKNQYAVWSPALDELMKDDEVKEAIRGLGVPKSFDKKDDQTIEDAFRYARVIAAVAQHLGKPEHGQMFFLERRSKMKFYSWVEENGIYKMQLVRGMDEAVIDVTSNKLWPMHVDDLDLVVLHEEADWEGRLRDIIPELRKDYRQRKEKITDLQERAKVYGLTETDFSA